MFLTTPWRYCKSQTGLFEVTGFIQITPRAPKRLLQTASEVVGLKLSNNFTSPYHIKKKNIVGGHQKEGKYGGMKPFQEVMIDVFISSSFSSTLPLSHRGRGSKSRT